MSAGDRLVLIRVQEAKGESIASPYIRVRVFSDNNPTPQCASTSTATNNVWNEYIQLLLPQATDLKKVQLRVKYMQHNAVAQDEAIGDHLLSISDIWESASKNWEGWVDLKSRKAGGENTKAGSNSIKLSINMEVLSAAELENASGTTATPRTPSVDESLYFDVTTGIRIAARQSYPTDRLLASYSQTQQLGIQDLSAYSSLQPHQVLTKDILASAVNEKQVYRLGGDGSSLTVLAPKVFSTLQRFCGVSAEDMQLDWSYSLDTLPTPSLGAGRSGSMFLFSKSRRFLVKTMPEKEALTLLRILGDYFKHITKIDKLPSRLMKIFGLYNFYNHRSGKTVYLTVADNITFTPDNKVFRIYDLKGRKTKHKAAPKVKSGVYKDNQLFRTFHMESQACVDTIATLTADASFLEKMNLIDYSILVGIVKDTPKASEAKTTESTEATEENKTSVTTDPVEEAQTESTESAETVQTTAVERKVGSEVLASPGPSPNVQSSARTGATATQTSEEKKNLLQSILGELDQEAVHPTGLAAHVPSHQEVFQIGIIDFLAPYETKKKIANFFKTQIFLPESLSTIPAAAYAKRFIDYLPAIFLTCTCTEGQKALYHTDEKMQLIDYNTQIALLLEKERVERYAAKGLASPPRFTRAVSAPESPQKQQNVSEAATPVARTNSQ